MTTPSSVNIDMESIKRGAVLLAKSAAFWLCLLAFAGTAYIMALLAADPNQSHRWVWGAIGVVCSLLALVFPLFKAGRSERSAAKLVTAAEDRVAAALARAQEAEAARAEALELAVDLQARFNSSIGDVISPIASQLAALSCAADDAVENQRGAVLQQIVDAAVTLSGGDGVRAAIYKYARMPDGKPGDLVRQTWTGRHDPPRQKFSKKRADARERAVHELVANRAYDLQDDVLELDHGSYKSKRYRSLVAVAISADVQPRGMIAIDAPEVARFDRTHLGILLALGGLAAIALDA